MSLQSRIGFLTLWRISRRISEKDFAKCALGRELIALMTAPDVTIAPEHIRKPFSLAGAPMPHEIQFQSSNWADCQDWIRANYVAFINHYV